MPSVQPSAADARFVESIPRFYDRYLGPLLFTPYAIDLASRVRLPSTEDAAVLEIAAGTGIFTEQLRARLPAGVALTVTDLNAPMLALAEQRLAAAGRSDGITWRTVDATNLPFP
ncbi:MAG: methyltransferase domain-containing protein, partial [Gemmatimonas sp.]